MRGNVRGWTGLILLLALFLLLSFSVCAEETEEAEPAIMVARVDLTGDMKEIGKKERVLLQIHLEDKAETFDGYAYTSWQGHSSLKNVKKNYTIRLFDDEEMTMKHRMNLREGWQAEHKYILKANYKDLTMSRNLICADLWAEMAATRKSIPDKLKVSSHYGAVDGFAAEVTLNGEFLGLYSMNLHKDDDLYGMEWGRNEIIMICNADSSEEARFRAEPAYTEESDWEIEYDGADDEIKAKEAFTALVRFVMKAEDGQFRTGLGEKLDQESAEDYLIFLYAMGLTRGGSKDLILLKYEEGPWIATVYDMEEAFGLTEGGEQAKNAGEFLPAKREDGTWDSGTGSLLWDRLLNVFEEEIRARYRELREGPLATEHMLAVATARLNAVPQELMDRDLAAYPDRKLIENPKEQILSYIEDRMTQLDEVFGK